MTVEKVALVTAGGSGMGADAAKRERRERIPKKRYGRAGEVSSLIAWLASENAAYMTAQNLRIDGGLTRAV